TSFQNHNIVKFNPDGSPAAPTSWVLDDVNAARFGTLPPGTYDVPSPWLWSDLNSSNESIITDAAGNFYVGQASAGSSGPFTSDVLKFSPAGVLLDRLDVAITQRGSDWIDLASDQRTLYYTSEGREIKRYDLRTHTQLADFAPLPGLVGEAYALRILPGGGVL